MSDGLTNGLSIRQLTQNTSIPCLQAVLVDMEEGVVSEMMKGPLREVFDFKQLLTDVSGAGNNW